MTAEVVDPVQSYDPCRVQKVNEINIPDTKMGMFSTQGARAVQRLVRNVIARTTRYRTTAWVAEELEKKVKKVAQKHPEVHDTAVREEIVGTVNRYTGSEVSIFDV